METREEKCGDDSSDDIKKVGSKVDKKELRTFMTDFMERYMRPTSKIVLKSSSASDLAPSTAVSEAEPENNKKNQKGYATQLQSVVRDKMYTRMKFVKSKELVLYMAGLGLSTGYVRIPIDWKKQNFKLHLKKRVYQAYNQI